MIKAATQSMIQTVQVFKQGLARHLRNLQFTREPPLYRSTDAASIRRKYIKQSRPTTNENIGKRVAMLWTLVKYLTILSANNIIVCCVVRMEVTDLCQRIFAICKQTVGISNYTVNIVPTITLSARVSTLDVRI